MRFGDNLDTAPPHDALRQPGADDLVACLEVGARRYDYVDLRAAERMGLAPVSRLPVSLRILLENILRHRHLGDDSDLAAVCDWIHSRSSEREINFYPTRVLMPDSSGVPLIGDMAAMRDAVRAAGGDPTLVNPLIPVDIVIDHSVITDHAGTPQAYDLNLALEYQRNAERYTFLKWAQGSFTNFRVVPPSMGIVHQVNLEYLSRVVWTGGGASGPTTAYPDTLVGMDSHTTMVNGIGVLGWGVGGIEAGAVMLSQPISMQLPQVVGCQVTGRLRPGVTSTDIVLTLTERLRQHKVVGKFVEFYGDGLDHLPVSHRATIANMAPESGATMCFFPTDQATIDYLIATGRSSEQVALVQAYVQAQGLWRGDGAQDIAYSEFLVFDLESVQPSLAGPRRPQDRVDLCGAAQRFVESYADRLNGWRPQGAPIDAAIEHRLDHGDIVIAAITSCTNTANPPAMVGAGLLARKLRARGVVVKPWVKTSLAPGSRVVTDYLRAAGLQDDLDALGFNLVGYGCMTCAGASGQLDPKIAGQIETGELVVATVLSSNRNFEGRTHALARANFLCSPALVVAYACAGSITLDLTREPLALDRHGAPVWLADVWPSDNEIEDVIQATLSAELFTRRYATVFEGDRLWQRLQVTRGLHYDWDPRSTYIRRPPYFEAETVAERFGQGDILAARPLVLLGDSITTDHISPVNVIGANSPAGAYLASLGVALTDFNTLLARRGNHDVMVRGTFANPRLVNEMVVGREGGWTCHTPSSEVMRIHEAAQRYRTEGTPLLVVAGTEYGTGSSRDWAAKGLRLLGVRAVIAESFERIHRSNLVGMGVLPLQFPPGVTRHTLGLTGEETFSITGLGATLVPRHALACEIRYAGGRRATVPLLCRLDIPREIAWYRHGGILQYVVEALLVKSSQALAPSKSGHSAAERIA